MLSKFTVLSSSMKFGSGEFEAGRLRNKPWDEAK